MVPAAVVGKKTKKAALFGGSTVKSSQQNPPVMNLFSSLGPRHTAWLRWRETCGMNPARSMNDCRVYVRNSFTSLFFLCVLYV